MCRMCSHGEAQHGFAGCFYCNCDAVYVTEDQARQVTESGAIAMIIAETLPGISALDAMRAAHAVREAGYARAPF